MIKTIGEVPITNKKARERMKAMQKPFSEYCDKIVLKRLFNKGMSLFCTGKFRNKRVPKYFKIRVPVIRKYFCEDTDENGLLITTKEISLFRIGTKVIKVPVIRKLKGKKIRFRRFGALGAAK